MPAKVHIIFHSLWGHVWKLAEAVAEGARSTGAAIELFQVKELLSDDILAKMHALDAKKAFAHIPLADPARLADADAIFLGTGTRYGASTASMQAFLDSTGALWMKGALVGKIGSAFASTGTQHGGQETTLTHLHTFFYHQGMLVAGCPYAAQELLTLSEITGGTPYGATTMAGPTGARQPTPNELAIAKFQGSFVAEKANKLTAK